MKKNKISIRDVATLAGTSIGSASRVINGASNVTPEIKKKILDAIQKLQYQPNHAAQTLRSKNTKTIGCMFSDVANPLYAKAFKSLEKRFNQAGYMLLLANGLHDSEREISIIKTFQARAMDGVVIAPSNEQNPALLNAIKSLTMPVVVYDRDIKIDSDAVYYDHKSGIKSALNYLFDLGHKNIALVLWNAQTRVVRLRAESYQEAFLERNRPSPDLIIKALTPTSSVFSEVTNALRQPNPPTAFIAQGTQILSSTLRAIATCGLSIPKDVSLISIGDSEFAENHTPPLSALRTPTESVAEVACEMILEKIKNKSAEIYSPAIQQTFQYSLVVRESCSKISDN